MKQEDEITTAMVKILSLFDFGGRAEYPIHQCVAPVMVLFDVDPLTLMAE